jgi:hypothetical protein
MPPWLGSEFQQEITAASLQPQSTDDSGVREIGYAANCTTGPTTDTAIFPSIDHRFMGWVEQFFTVAQIVVETTLIQCNRPCVIECHQMLPKLDRHKVMLKALPVKHLGNYLTRLQSRPIISL